MAQNVASPSAAVQEMQEAWDLADALLDGTSEMRRKGEKYLPKWPGEDDKSYKARLATAVLFPAYSRTVATLAAKPFSKPITRNDVPDQAGPWLDDVDREGRNIDAFAASVMECAMGMGLTGILVDFPDATEAPATAAGVRTQADEAAAGLRPYWVHIKPEQIRGWRVGIVNGQKALTMLRLMECVTEADGEWGTREVEQVRVLTPGVWQIWRKPEGKTWDDAVLHKEGTTTLGLIPFAPVYGKREGFMEGEPPLIEVAHLNVAHWQSASDQQTILHVARVPILTVRGVGENFELKVGASVAVNLGEAPTAEARYVEHTGAAIQAGADDLKALEERMRQAGAELLVIDNKLTATQVSTENAVGMCALQRITLGLQDALNLALTFTALWAKIDTAGTVTLFNDFGFGSLAEATAQIVKDMAAAGLISKETAFKEQQRRGVLDASLQWEEEQGRIDGEGPPLGSVLPVATPAPAPGNPGA